MHLVIYFCGTGDSGHAFSTEHAGYAKELQAKNTHTLIVNGCQHEEVCNNGLTPNLDEFANRFMRKAFTNNAKGQTILSRSNSTELAQLGVGIQPDNYLWAYDEEENEYVQIVANEDGEYKLGPNQFFVAGPEVDNRFQTNEEPIESITFVGYSRGAVTCFNMAQAAEKMGITAPVRIVADQPVPGTLYALPGTNAANIADCRKLKNVESVDVSVGAYTGNVETPGFAGKLQRLFHRLFFSQVIPKLPENADVNLSVIPRVHHWQGGLTGSQHLHMNLTKRLANAGLLSPGTADNKRQEVIDYYKSCSPIFPGSAEMQSIFGSNVAHMYGNVDKHYIESLTPKQYDEFLYKWWQAQETQASIFSTKLTKNLVAALGTTNPEVANKKLLEIFEKADEWLLMKYGLGSSRYEQVMNLRENVRERLLQKCDNVEEMTEHLNNINRKLIYTTHYFERQWKLESKAASMFKTDATRELGQAFKEHASAEAPSRENDEKLLTAIDKWLQAKQPKEEAGKSSSSRYELVGRMREQLVEVMERYPQQQYAQSATL